MKHQITEYLDLDLDTEQWLCNRCGHVIGPARDNYKKGCLVAARDPSEIWRPIIDGPTTFTYPAGWSRIVEFYCPGCATLIEIEMLPPGHPITYDIELDVDSLRGQLSEQEADQR
jgi:acetone carboxylase gamma subunit